MTDQPQSPRAITINSGPPNVAILAQIEHTLGTQLPDGDYWYDYRCGACGLMGGPAQGFLRPGLALGGPLPPNASGDSGTGCFVNGRELHTLDIVGLNQLLMRAGGQCLPGRWSLDATGNLGPENGIPMINLVQLASMGAPGAFGGATGGGDNSWSTRYASGNSSGGAGFIQFSGGGSVSYGM